VLEVNKIYNEDCLEGLKNIDSNSIDLVVTDPPYLINYKTNYRKDKEHKFCKVIKNDNNPELIKDVISELYRVMKDNTAMYMFCSFDKVDFFKQELEKYFNIKNLIIWVKNNWTAGDLECAFGKQYEMCFLVNKGKKQFNGKRITDVWGSFNTKGLNRVVGEEQIHQNQKPLELIKMCIEKHSNEDDLILDPFMGSGTTAVACKELERNYIGFEIDHDYYEKSIERIKGIKPNGQTTIFTDFDNL
jgi:DNA modification methylase